MQHYLIAEDHYYYGWGLFAVALIPMLLFAQWQANRAIEPPVSTERSSTSGVVHGGRIAGLAVPAVFAALLVVPLAISLSRDDEPGPQLAFELPEGASGWERAAAGDWRPVYVGADGEALESYARDGARVDAYVAVYRSQSQGRELVGNDNRLFGAGWRQEATGRVEVQGLDGVAEVQERVIVPRQGRPRLVWLWYSLGERRVAQDLVAKLFQAVGSLWGRDSGAVIAVSAPCPDDCSEVRGQLREFVRAMGEPLSRLAESQQGDSAQ